MELTLKDRQWVESAAKMAGFDLAGLADVPEPDSQAGLADEARFSAWIDSGAAGEMEWLKRRTAEGALVRGDLRRSLPWARSVLVCAVNYNTQAPRSIDAAPEGAGWIARYAWSGRGGAAMHPDTFNGVVPGSDYHEELLPRLREIARLLSDRFGPDCLTRAYVDTGPILERGYAARAGVGWIGRNTCILNQEQGSWLLLGVVVTSLELADDTVPLVAADRCGSCTRCIEACPTDALHGSGLEGRSRSMDATRCIAYLTIEKKGVLEKSLRESMGRQIFGCDICQDVCPWNRRAPVGGSGMLAPRRELVNPSLGWLASLDAAQFKDWFRGSPLERTRRPRLLRNIAIAMGNSGDVAYLSQLQTWSRGEDEVLAEAADWALARLTSQEGVARSPDDELPGV